MPLGCKHSFCYFCADKI
nr:hypothetical protein [Bacteroides sp.]